MKEHFTEWLAGAVLGLGILLLCGWLDHEPTDQTCVAEIKDGGGHVHYISGTIADISKD